MKHRTVLAVLMGLALVAAGSDFVAAHDYQSRGECLNCWEPGYGPGYWGPGMGPGYGYGYGYGRGRYGYRAPDRSAFGSDLSKGEAKKLVQWLIRGYPTLEVGDVTAVEDGFEVQVVTRKGNVLVDRLLVEKETGWVYRIYE